MSDYKEPVSFIDLGAQQQLIRCVSMPLYRGCLTMVHTSWGQRSENWNLSYPVLWAAECMRSHVQTEQMPYL